MSADPKLTRNLLVSINFESSKGGIARVARLMAEAIPFDLVLSLYGDLKELNVRYHRQNSWKFMMDFLWTFYTRMPNLIVFDHVGPASLLGFIPSLFLKNKKIVVFLHDEEAWRKVSKRHAWGLRKSTHILCNSNYTYKKFIASNPEYKFKTHVCLLAGVPSSFLSPISDKLPEQHTTWFTSQNPYCVFVSRLWKEHRYKGHFELIEAYNLHYQKNPNAKLRLAIIGNGNDVDNINQYIDQHKLTKVVQVFTGINDTALIQFYKHSCGLIFPSTREGFGFVFLEAMYFSKVCIGIKDQPAEEIIIAEKTGKLLDNNHPSTILSIIESMENYPDQFKTLGMEGKLLFESKFMNKHFIARFLDCIDEK